MNTQGQKWQKVKLGNVTYITKLAGYEFTKFFNSYKQPGEIIVLRGQNLKQGKLDLTDTKTIGQKISQMLPRSQIKTNDLVFSYVGTIGPVALIKEDNKYHLGPNICKITPGNQILPKFLLQYFLSSKIKEEITKKISITAQPSLSMEKIRDFELLIPTDIEIQQKIAEVLSSVDEAIQKTDQVIQKTEVLKQGLMQGLLTKGIGHKKFKKTKLGEIPEEWDLVRIEQTSQVKGGKRLPKGTPFATEVTSHPYLRIVDFKNMTINTSNIKYIDENIFKQISRYIISKEDVYISIAGTIGIVGLIPEELNGASLTENAAKIIIQKGFVKEYLAYFLSSSLGQSQIRDLTVKTTQPKLALNKIEQILIPIPPLDEQKKIIKILSGLFSKIENENEQKEALLILKKGLMQDIFSQKVQIN